MSLFWRSVSFTLIVCGLRPNFIVRMDCARVAVKVLIAFASMS